MVVVDALVSVNDRRRSQSTGYIYDANGNLSLTTLPNSIENRFTYDRLNRLTNLQSDLVTPFGPFGVQSYTYQLHPSGHRQSVLEFGRAVSYEHDNLWRLTKEIVNSFYTADTGEVSYSLDPVGNRLTRGVSGNLPALTTQANTFDANDRLGSHVTDNNGNTQDNTKGTFTYDYEDRIKTATVNGVVMSFVYDGDGNRVVKTADGVTTRYLVDDLNPTDIDQVVEEIDANGDVIRVNVFGNGIISTDRKNGPAWTQRFYGFDGSGSVRYLTDDTGTTTDTFDYDAYGVLLTRTGASENDYLYAGEQFDPQLGLYYNRARYLDPDTGRFMSMDSFEGDDTVPQSLHKYGYADVDPVNNHDPSGHMSLMFAFGMIQNLGASMSAHNTLWHTYSRGRQLSVEQMNLLDATGFVHDPMEREYLRQQAKYYSDSMLALSMETDQDFFETSLDTFYEVIGLTGLLRYYDMTQMTGTPEDVEAMVDYGFEQIGWERQSFVAGTQIETPEGNKSIEQINVGDLVLSKNQRTGEQGFKRVLVSFEHPTNSICSISVVSKDGDGRIEGTATHPFWSTSRQRWVDMGDLKLEEALLLSNGCIAKVTSIETRKVLTSVYNFEVEDWNTYYVAHGTTGVLVHNKGQRWQNKKTKSGRPYRKPGPKKSPHAPHNKKIRAVIKKYQDKGYKHIGGGKLTERTLQTSAGTKPYRRVDASFRKNGKTTHVNVGLTTKKGIPVKRERDALKDLRSHHHRVRFEGYN